MTSEDRLLTAAEVADRLGVPASWVAQKAREDAIPHRRLGRYVRFHWPDVAAWLETQQRRPRRAA